MDRVELAMRRFQHILPRPVENWANFPDERLTVWLSDDVGPVVEDYSRRSSFREQASWPLRVLNAQAESPERVLVNAVDHSIVQTAKALHQLGPNRLVVKKLEEQNPPKVFVSEEVVEINERGVRRLEVKRDLFDTSRAELAQIEQIAERPWTSLVCLEDYLQPLGGWLDRSGPSEFTEGEFVVSLNPKLHPVGDFVTRCLLRRVDVLHGLLERFRGKCLRAVRAAGPAYSRQCEEAERCWQRLTQAVTELHKRCETGLQSQLRDSCIILTQVYLAFHPAPDVEWLGLPEDLTQYGRRMLRHRVTHQHDAEMIDRIAVALGDLRRLYEDEMPGQSALEEAISGGGLVLVSAPPAAYWEGRRIPADLGRLRRAWLMLYNLASKARLGAAIQERDLYDDVKSESNMATTLNRLKKILPPSLKKLIIPAKDMKRSYRLDLARHRIHIVERDRRFP